MDKCQGDKILNLVRQANAKLDRNIKKHFCCCGLTAPQAAVLTLLHQNQQMKISDISCRMGLSNGTMTGIIDRLEKMELVKRVRLGSDRRIIIVTLTEKANAFSNNFDIIMGRCLSKIFDCADDDEISAIIKGLEVLNNILDNMEQI